MNKPEKTTQDVPGIPISFEDGTDAVRGSVCSECRGPLTLPWGGFWKHEGYLLQCGRDRTHSGIRLAETAVEYIERREGGGDRFLSMLQNNQDLQTLIADVKQRLIEHSKPVPDRDVAAFLVDCAKLGLDPFSRQIFPVPFRDESEGTYRLATIISVRGLGSIAQRAMPSTWVMAPSTEPVKRDDPIVSLLLDGLTRTVGWQNDPADGKSHPVKGNVLPEHVVVARAKGKVRTPEGIEETDWVYAFWYLSDSLYGTEKGNTPMRMAMNRAARGWYETYYPAAKAIMQGLQVPMLERAQGFISALRIVEGRAVAVEGAVLPERATVPTAPPEASPSPAPAPRAATAPAQRPISSERMASENQTKALYAISRGLGWDRDRLVREFGGKAPDELTFADASLAIDRLKKLEEAAKPKLA